MPPIIVDTPPARAQGAPTAVLVGCKRKITADTNEAQKKHDLFQKKKIKSQSISVRSNIKLREEDNY